MKTAWRMAVLTVALLAVFRIGSGQARAQASRAYGYSMSGPNYSYSWGYTPGLGRYQSSSVSPGGGVQISNYSGYQPGAFVGYGVPAGTPRGVSVSGPGYTYSRGYTPGLGGYYSQSVNPGGGVQISTYRGLQPGYMVGYPIPYVGPPVVSQASPPVQIRTYRQRRISPPRLPFVRMPRMTVNPSTLGYH